MTGPDRGAAGGAVQAMPFAPTTTPPLASGTQADLRIPRAAIGPLLRDVLRVPWNELSPFAAELSEHSSRPVGDRGTLAALARDPRVTRTIPVLGQPTVRVRLRYGGPRLPTASLEVLARRDRGESTVVAVQPEGLDAVTIRSFESAAACLAWVTAGITGESARSVPNGLAGIMDVESLVYALHALDAYRRAPDDPARPAARRFVSPEEFASGIATALASRDLRWVLPSFLALTPGFDTSALEPRPDHLRPLVQLHLLVPGRTADTGKEVFYFGDTAARMAGELADGWELACGMESTIWAGDGRLTRARAFVVADDVSNHLFQLWPAAGRRWVAEHQPLGRAALIAALTGALFPPLEDVAIERAPRGDIPNADRAGPAIDAKHPTRPGAKSTTVREWFRMTGPALKVLRRRQEGRWREGSVALNATGLPILRDQFESLAKVLESMRTTGTLRRDEFASLHGLLTCKSEEPGADGARSTWTVGLKTLKWHRLEGGQWVAAAPPEPVFLDAELVQTFCAMPSRRTASGLVVPKLDPRGPSVAPVPRVDDSGRGAAPQAPARSAATAASGEVRRFEHPAPVVTVSVVPDVRHIVSFAEDETIRVWDAATGRLVRERKLDRGASHVAFSHDGRRALVETSAGPLELIEIETGRVMRRIGDGSRSAACALTPDGSRVVTAGSTASTPASGRIVRLWDLSSGRELRRFDRHRDTAVTCLAMSGDGKRILCGGDDADYSDTTVVGWELDTGRELARAGRPMMLVTSVTFSPDGRYAAAGSSDCSISIWEVATGRDLRHVTAHTGTVFSVAFSPDGRRLLSGSGSDFLAGTGVTTDNTVRLWDLKSGTEVMRFEGHTRNVNAVCFSPDGRHAISADSDQTVRLWKLPG